MGNIQTTIDRWNVSVNKKHKTLMKDYYHVKCVSEDEKTKITYNFASDLKVVNDWKFENYHYKIFFRHNEGERIWFTVRDHNEFKDKKYVKELQKQITTFILSAPTIGMNFKCGNPKILDDKQILVTLRDYRKFNKKHHLKFAMFNDSHTKYAILKKSAKMICNKDDEREVEVYIFDRFIDEKPNENELNNQICIKVFHIDSDFIQKQIKSLLESVNAYH